MAEVIATIQALNQEKYKNNVDFLEIRQFLNKKFALEGLLSMINHKDYYLALTGTFTK